MSRLTDFLVQRYKTFLRVKDNGEVRFGDDDDCKLQADGTGAAITKGNITHAGVQFQTNNFLCPAPGTDWTPNQTGMTLGNSKSSVNAWVPLSFLKVGDTLTGYKVLGDIKEVTACTLDAKLVKVANADPLNATSVASGAITQQAADGNFGAAVTGLAETVAASTSYVIEILGNTGASDAIDVQAVEVTATRIS